MSTRFTALTVREGDAFLLEDNGWNCLFDSGVNESIVDLLKYKGIEKLDLAICSHNDDDHAGGFIELLDSPIKIDEIWLPGLWASVLLFVKEKCMDRGEVELDDDDFNGDIDSLFSDESVSDESFNHGLSYLGELDDIRHFNGFNNRVHDGLAYKLAHSICEDPEFYYWRLSKLEKIDRELYGTISREVHYRHRFAFSRTHSKCLEVVQAAINRSLDISLNNIMRIASLAKQKCCNIRWFEPSTACTIESIEYGFVSLNSSKMCRIRKPKSGMAYIYLLQLSKVNKYSLVFDYTKNGVPLIRFSADSDSTCQSVSPYPKSIIVTAPHHGSKANAIVYDAIKGDDLIWVRSDERSSFRPCDAFKAQKNKYCLACKQYNFVSEICFEYNTELEKWDYVHGEQCRCKIH